MPYTKEQFAVEVLTWFNDYDKAIDVAPIKNQWDSVFGVQIPGQRDITMKYKKKLTILISKGKRFGHEVGDLAEHNDRMSLELAEGSTSDDAMFDD